MTIRNLRVLGIDSDENLLVIEGAVPGPKDGYVVIIEGEEATQRASWIWRLGYGRSVEGFEAPSREEEVDSSFQDPLKPKDGLNGAPDHRLGGSVTDWKKIMATIDV